ncbi:MAG: exodeoxyribonuclease small subunit [Thermoleophilia bacterium]|nr:exodeoxyribonuclease small subunit [Thermoleophilia bacterium]
MTDTTSTRPPVETLTFEQAQAELEAIVEQLEDRHTGLDAALELWERGEALHAWCQQRLDYAAERLHKLTVSADEVAAVQSESADSLTPTGTIAPDAADDPAPASSPSDLSDDSSLASTPTDAADKSAPASTPTKLDIVVETDQTIIASTIETGAGGPTIF